MILDDLNKIKKLDSGRVADSIKVLADQVRQVLEDSRLIKIPREYSRINQVVINGMGGSNIGGGLIKAVFPDQLKTPISIVPGYGVPESVDKNTLFIISSYSGGTEEPLSVYEKVVKRKAKILGITTKGGGQLEKLMIKNNIPGYIFDCEFNPSGQPRLGLGYSIFGLAVMMAKVGLFKINIKEIEDIIASLEIWDRELRPEISAKNNRAKKIAGLLKNKIPIIVGAEFLQGNLRIFRNQLNETSKNFASYLTLPDANHYALEGLAYPKSNKNNLLFLFLNSDFYHIKNQKRLKITKNAVEKYKIQTVEYKLTGETKFKQAFEMLQIGTWITFYLAMLNEVDPVKIPYVDWFKKELKK